MKVSKAVRQKVNGKSFAKGETGEIEVNANLIVGADGDHSAVLRSLGKRKINRKHYAGAVRQYWKGIEGIHPQNFLEVYLPKSLPLAYFWIFPLGNGEANVGCGLASDLIAESKIDLKDLLHKLITEEPALADRFKNAVPLEKVIGWGLPLASQQRDASGDGWLLVGDAASLISPTTGEGIGPGMMSGYTAANFIARAVKNKRFDKQTFANYDREIYKRMQGDIKKYKLLRSLSPGIYNWVINVFTITGISGLLIKKNAAKWIETARSKPIEIDL
jgi:flavin-dependent dehydrogenase